MKVPNDLSGNLEAKKKKKKESKMKGRPEELVESKKRNGLKREAFSGTFKQLFTAPSLDCSASKSDKFLSRKGEDLLEQRPSTSVTLSSPKFFLFGPQLKSLISPSLDLDPFGSQAPGLLFRLGPHQQTHQ